MASVNPHTRELVFKLVFYGPGLGGKTTTLQYIYAATKAEHRGKMVSLATPTDRTLYFDFLPIRVPRVRGMAVRLQLFTVPGQVYYAATRKLVLSGADGIVFVADSQAGRIEMNQESLEDLHANLAEHNRALEQVPHTFHWNKRDLSDLVPIDELERRFNQYDAPSLGTVATKGEGVFEGLERIARLVLKSYENDPKIRIEASNESSRGSGKLPEDAIAHALREMETAQNQGTVALAGGIEAPTKISQVLPDVGTRAPSPAREPQQDGAAAEAPAKVADVADPAARPSDATRLGSGAWGRFTFPEPPGPDVEQAEPPLGTMAPEARRDVPVFSLAELWPDPDRDGVRQAEAMIAARDAVNAILACDVLVTRVLASAAGLVGTLDAPRDPAVVSLLLGLEGTRYLQFRTLVRAARHREQVTMKDALECFSFALEARRARENLRR
jgi:signal recognition particle receptor subunit beta